MAQTSLPFKDYERGTRTIVVEDSYSGGISYVNNSQDTEYIRNLVNFNYKADGKVMAPRRGFCSQLLDFGNPIISTEHTENLLVAPLALFTTDADQKILYNCFLSGAAYTDEVFTQEDVNKTYVSFPKEHINLLAIPHKYTDFPQPIANEKYNIYDYTEQRKVEPAEDCPDFSLACVRYDSGALYGFETSRLNANQLVGCTFDNTYIAAGIFEERLKLGYFKLNKNESGAMQYAFKPLEPLEISIREAVSTGYNMLLDNPYEFKNIAGTGYAVNGIVPYNGPPENEDRELLLDARQGDTLFLEVYYNYKAIDAGSNATITMQYADVNNPDSWTKIPPTDTDAFVVGNRICFKFTPPILKFNLKVTLTKTSSDTAVFTMPMTNLIKANSGYKSKLAINYDLATATGMVAWKERLVLWGVEGALNTLFISEAGNPQYFPYPSNTDQFDEPIIHCVNYTDSLLVFTKTKMYNLNFTSDGLSFVATLVQNRLSIKESDKNTVQVIKNMVFFKSGDYFYMVVPKLNSLTNELVIAPVSKPITAMLDDMKSAIVDTLNNLYFGTVATAEYSGKDFTLLNFYNYLDGNAIRNVFTVELDEATINFVLNYDTSIRAWTVYVHEAPGASIAYTTSITQGTVLFTTSASVAGEKTEYYTYLSSFNKVDCKDYMPRFIDGVLNTELTIANYQYIDTGFRNHVDQLKKRYREIQLVINNTSGLNLTYSMSFFIDDAQRVSFFKRTPRHDTDKNSSTYGLYYIESEAVDNLEVGGSTVLNSSQQDAGWTLDLSAFPDLATVKVRIPVSGKGYAPRLKLLSFNEASFELHNINWVARTLYGR